MMIPFIKQRIEEVRQMVAQNDLSLATRRYMDLVNDLGFSKELRQVVVGLRMRYNQLKTLDEKQAFEEKSNITSDLLKSLDTCEKEAFVLFGASSTKNIGTFEDEKQSFLKNRHIIYQAGEEARLPEDVFRCTEVYKTYKSHNFSLTNVNLTLKQGEITGIVGENGNGKTTLLRIIAGELLPDRGFFSYPALQVSHNVQNSDWYKIKHQIAFIPQNLAKWEGTLKENLHFAAANHGIFGDENEESVDFIIHRLGLTRYRYLRWKDISSGYKLRFELAKALVWHPKILVLDEPLANLDINAKMLFMQDLKLLANSVKYPVSIIMSSQQLHEIESVVDNIIFLKEGKTLYNGRMDAFEKDRSTNTFEIAGEYSRGELFMWLKELTQDFRIEDTGHAFMIEVPKEISANHVLGHLSSKHKIEYFRDISQSTRKLFH